MKKIRPAGRNVLYVVYIKYPHLRKSCTRAIASRSAAVIHNEYFALLVFVAVHIGNEKLYIGGNQVAASPSDFVDLPAHQQLKD